MNLVQVNQLLVEVLFVYINQTSGSIVFNGKEIGGKLDKATAKELHTKMQMIFQDPMACLNPRKKVIDIIGQGLDIHKSYSSIEERNEKSMKFLNL